ncbi:hypothetical protein KM043_007143 [Ampulex compressa]|nr:hypothetical protein KM043_007143 [Ampulex compressa]
MEKEDWNADMAYAFSVHRLVLWIFGSWPLQENTFSSHIRWTLTTMIELSLTVPAVMDVFESHVTHEATLENLLFLECGILALAKNFFPRMHVNKLARNIQCAMIDWSTVLREESSYRIMKNIVMHICGQLQVLSMKLKNLGRYHKMNVDYKKELVFLVRRHCELIELVKNVENTFNMVILLQIMLSVILIALGGVRIIVSVAARNNVQILQNFIIIIFLIFQCSFYTHAGDLLQTCSEQIFFDIYDAPWYRFTPAASKNVQVIMMKANIPLRITGGKLIDISCKTTMNILKSAASYVSVLSATTEE